MIRLKWFIIATLCVLQFSCKNREQNKTQSNELSGDLVIFHAGSLSVPFNQISEAFEKEYPEVHVVLESSGSRTCARKIIDLKRDCDIMASADYTVIDQLLIPKYASWNIKFTSNEMCIVFTDKSRFHDQINNENWIEILLNKEVTYGRSDPNSDPCGYRAILSMKLAEKFYNKPGMVNMLINKDKNYIRPKETDLLSLLETGSLDYIFLYRSVAEQHELDYLLLPDEVNLKNSKFSSLYQSVDVEISGKKPGEKIIKNGEPMVYGVTVINNAPNKNTAIKFVEFLLTANKGMAIMKKNGQASVVPEKCESYHSIPAELKRFVKE